MKHPKDLSGLKFGKLKVLKQVVGFKKEGQSVWLCKCICDKEVIVGRKELVNGSKRSCGCNRITSILKMRCLKCNKVQTIRTKLKNKEINIICEECATKILDRESI